MQRLNDQFNEFDMQQVQTTSFEEHLRIKQRKSDGAKENPAGLSESELLYSQGLAMQPAQNDFEHALLTSMSINDNELKQQGNN